MRQPALPKSTFLLENRVSGGVPVFNLKRADKDWAQFKKRIQKLFQIKIAIIVYYYS